jgi:uncharacterized protein YndB with AHSA1/START domain
MSQQMFRIERSTVLAAPAEQIFPLIEDFHTWAKWSPYERLDPAMKKSFSGAEKGVGAAYAWEGKKAGTGTMSITAAVPTSKVVIELEFTRPMKAQNTAEFTLEPAEGGTRVTWSMVGKQTWFRKLIGVFVDGMIGDQFEEGLANLKAVAEGKSATR